MTNEQINDISEGLELDKLRAQSLAHSQLLRGLFWTLQQKGVITRDDTRNIAEGYRKATAKVLGEDNDPYFEKMRPLLDAEFDSFLMNFAAESSPGTDGDNA